MFSKRLPLALIFGFLALGGLAHAQPPRKALVYVGTYTGGPSGSKGIYALDFDLEGGTFGAVRLVAETVSPSFLALHPRRPFLYAVNEVDTFNGKPGGGVSAFAIDEASGGLTLANAESSGGGSPCHLVVDAAGRNVLVANYGGGSVGVLPLRAEGQVGPMSSFIQHKGSGTNPARQEGPHAHSINLDGAGRFAFVADLGLDKVFAYRFNAETGNLTPNEPASTAVAPGAGPRHFAFHPNGRTAYVINELNSTVTAFVYDAERGALKSFQSLSTLPSGVSVRNYPADVQVHPSGKFLYGSNRGHDSIAVFAIKPEDGSLSFVEAESAGVKNPRNFAIAPGGEFVLVANQDADSIHAFKVEPNGALTPNNQSVKVPKPVCLKFRPPIAP